MISRKGLLTAGAASAVTGVVGAKLGSQEQLKADQLKSQVAVGKASVSPYGKHQAGVELELQAFSRFIAFDVLKGTTKADLRRWVEIITDDIVRLTHGDPVLADPAPQFSGTPARLTVTVGFGASLFEKLSLESPAGFRRLPKFSIDNLKTEFSDGDILIQVGGDDLLSLSHASRSLIRDTESFATVRWVQEGFTNSQGVTRPGATQRNLMGQVDGTDNPELGTKVFNDLVWMKDVPEWAIGGTQLVLRRIKMKLDTWDRLSTEQKEGVIGRRLSNGAPLTGKNERDFPNLSALDKDGLEVIPSFAHIRNAAGAPGQQFFRRPFNYEVPPTEAGLLWTAYCANLSEQYLPVQQKLADGDLLNLWTEPVGSAVFVIPRGFQPGEILASELFS